MPRKLLAVHNCREFAVDYAERAYFDGDHCHHCATRDEHRRLERKRVQAIRSVERRNGGRYMARNG